MTVFSHGRIVLYDITVSNGQVKIWQYQLTNLYFILGQIHHAAIFW